MIPTLVDTDILSRFFRNDARVVNQFDAYCREQGVICLSIINRLPGLIVEDWAA